ncbi:MAG: glycoside hydrolase family 30 beta sandwich domain-containing protein [Bacteroides cellulosilyticus]
MSVETTDKEGKAIRDGDTDQQGLMCSAYRNTNGQWAMVVINYADREQKFTVDVNDPKGEVMARLSYVGCSRRRPFACWKVEE